LGEDAGGDERWRTQRENLSAPLTERGIAGSLTGGHEDAAESTQAASQGS
jgi:hypothetical protein